MKKLLTAFVVGCMMIGLGGPLSIVSAQCVPAAPPVPSFDPPAGTYGYSLDLTNPSAPVPILQAVEIGKSLPANIIFFTLDGSDPVFWDPRDPEDPHWANVANLAGSIPYLDLSSEDPPGPDLTQFTSVGVLYFMGLAAHPPVPGPATTTIKAIEFDTSFAQTSEIAEATYTIDPTMWNGDYIVVGHSPLNPMDPLTADIPLQVLVGLLSVAGGGFATIDGDLTITDLYWANPLGLLYGCYPPWAPGCLTAITGDLIVKHNAAETTADIDAMEAAVTVGGSVIHCGNADDDPCPEDTLTINLCAKTVDCATPPGGEWACDVGGAAATVAYTPEGATFQVQLEGTAPSDGVDYELVYYPDPYPGNGLICLGSATSDGTTGAINIPWTSNDIGEDLPIPSDTAPLGGAKLMLLPSTVVDCDGRTTSGWSCDALFGASDATDIITYTYTP